MMMTPFIMQVSRSFLTFWNKRMKFIISECYVNCLFTDTFPTGRSSDHQNVAFKKSHGGAISDRDDDLQFNQKHAE